MRACVLVPTYDNAGTVEEVVRGAVAVCPEVIVIDDGSREPIAPDGFDGVTVLRHEENRGKGAAMQTGFEHARGLGFTHAITIDADGQHPPDQIPLLLAAAEAAPDAMILGARDLRAAGAGLGSRFGCRNSNFWTWAETGLRLPDTQTGLRCYPLAGIAPLRLRTTGYDFEIEVLVKAAWAGIPVTSVPVKVLYPEDRVSHMRPVLDFIRIAFLNTRFVFMRLCLPAPYLGLVVQRRYHDMPWRTRLRESMIELFVREPGSTRRVALSVSLGLFMGLAPIWGFQIAATLLVAHVTRLSKTVAVVAAHISVPFMIPFIVYASLLIGRLALGEHAGPITTLELAPRDVPAWIIGSLLLATATAIVGGALAYLLVSGTRRMRRRST